MYYWKDRSLWVSRTQLGRIQMSSRMACWYLVLLGFSVIFYFYTIWLTIAPHYWRDSWPEVTRLPLGIARCGLTDKEEPAMLGKSSGQPVRLFLQLASQIEALTSSCCIFDLCDACHHGIWARGEIYLDLLQLECGKKVLPVRIIIIIIF